MALMTTQHVAGVNNEQSTEKTHTQRSATSCQKRARTPDQNRQETGGCRDKDRHTWQLRDGMVLLSLGVSVFICRPPVRIFIFHRLQFCSCFLLSALVLHPITRTKKKGFVLVFLLYVAPYLQLYRQCVSALCLRAFETSC